MPCRDKSAVSRGAGRCISFLPVMVSLPLQPAYLPPSSIFPPLCAPIVICMKKLKVLYAQAALIVQSDDGGFVASVFPAANAFRDRAAGDEANFVLGMAATTPSAFGGGEVVLSFQGHKVRVRGLPLPTAHAVEYDSCILCFLALSFLCFFAWREEHGRCLSLTLGPARSTAICVSLSVKPNLQPRQSADTTGGACRGM